MAESKEDKKQLEALKKLREPFDPEHISKLPKGTKAQNECAYGQKKPCDECGGFHHPAIKHLDYVGHAALTHRLLDVDPLWNWEPVHTSESGFPSLDQDKGMWIKLTVCGLTRLGYGDAQGKNGPNATKERIGDALRNAGMRFGMALDLWHKGDLHADDNPPPDDTNPDNKKPEPQQEDIEPETLKPEDPPDIKYQEEIDACKKVDELMEWWNTESHRLAKESQHTKDAVSSYWAQLKSAYMEKESQDEK